MSEPRDPDRPGDSEGSENSDGEPDIERQWQEIVAGLGPLGDPPEETPEPQDRELSAYFEAAPVWGPRDYTVDDDPDEEFVPPEPPALGAGRPAIVLSATGLVGGPVALLLAAIFWPSIPGILITVLIAAFVAGAVGLFLALPRDQDRRNPWNDDGAQV
ncbi:hypothetical protein [Citricoccus sp. GCM10030269]|uniref:hypothetical protein n=1 Tax=Citricoccus sp. GCM10030269 TaxID=3273388 RepID=UPI00361CAAAE